MSRKSKVVKNYIFNTAYEILRIITPLITTPYISRVLGSPGVGTYSFAQSISTFFVLFGALGIGLYAQREIAYVQDDAEKRSSAFWEIEALRFSASLLSAIVYYVLFGRSSIVFGILTLDILASGLSIFWFFIGLEDFKTIFVRNTIVRLLGIILVFTFIKKPEDVPLYTLCVTAPTFVGELCLWINVKKYLVKVGKPSFTDIVKHIKPVLVLFIPQIAVEIYMTLDKTMIGVLSADMSQVGCYTQAQKIIRIALHIVTSLGTVMLPAMSAAFVKGENERIRKSIIKAFRFVFMVAFPLMFGICAVSGRFVPFFFGAGYDLVRPLMIVISPVLVIIGTSNVFGNQYLLPTKQQRAFTKSVVAGAAVNVILNFILIIKYGAIGASIATVLAELSVAVIQMWHVRDQLPIGTCLKPMIRYFLMAAVMFLAVSGIGRVLPEDNIYLFVMIAAGVLVYGLELIVTKDEILLQAIKMIRDKFPKKT